MSRCRVPSCFALMFLLACIETSAQTQDQGQTQDLAEAARQAKLKKQQSSSAKTSAKPKVYSNDDIPESKGAPEARPAEKPKEATSAVGTTTNSGKAPGGGRNSATVTVSPVRSSTPHPGGSEVDWSVHNTSDHALQISVTLLVKGPCNYNYQSSRNFNIGPGEQVGDNMFGFAVYVDSCPGRYAIELRATTNDQLLDKATAAVAVT